jgi:hypothetical protein
MKFSAGVIGSLVATAGLAATVLTTSTPAAVAGEAPTRLAPDLRPSCVRFATTPEVWELRCQVHNRGTAAARESVTLLQFDSPDGTLSRLLLPTRPLRAGGFTQLNSLRLAPGGRFSIRVDTLADVAELDEENNVQSCPPLGFPSGPDCNIQ